MTSRCGCKCICHTDERSPVWPGPCAACCEPGMDCECGGALAWMLDPFPPIPEWEVPDESSSLA